MIAICREEARQLARIAKAMHSAGYVYVSPNLSVYRAIRGQREALQGKAACQASIVPNETLKLIAEGRTMTGSRAISTLMENAGFYEYTYRV